MSSPIQSILNDVPGTIINIAPEREDETRRIVQGVQFELTDELGFGFSASVKERTIRVPERGVELLWALSYCLWRGYEAYREVAANVVPSASAPNSAIRLLGWALENQKVNSRISWPSGLPRPTGFESFGASPRPERVADELAMCAAGWLLHHELAHIQQGDSPYVAASVSRDQERRADRSATAWLLDQSPDGIPLEKRTIGIAAAVLCLIALELDNNVSSGPSRPYPAAADRLMESLSHRRLRQGIDADLIAAIGLRLLIDLFNINVPGVSYDDPADCIADYCKAVNSALSVGNVARATG